MAYSFNDFVRVMARLRGKNGCPWDRQQTHASLLKYLREESAEVAQAVRKKDYKNLQEELGDVLLQVVFHAQMAKEAGRFNIRQVVDGVCRKMIRRHPHVFGKKRLSTPEEVMSQWRKMKKEEKRRARRR